LIFGKIFEIFHEGGRSDQFCRHVIVFQLVPENKSYVALVQFFLMPSYK